MTPLPIPYDAQQPAMCGAAALRMVYRSFDLDVPQHAIWRVVAAKNRFGQVRAHTHKMTFDALLRGFAAITVKATAPILTLKVALSSQIRVIMNHRPSSISRTGHYTVAVGAGDGHIFYHDPDRGPSLRLGEEELLKLWRPLPGPSEIVEGVLVAIAPRTGQKVVCGVCETPIPESAACPGCYCRVPLRPAEVIGCLEENCPGRMWQSLFCPYCDWEISK